MKKKVFYLILLFYCKTFSQGHFGIQLGGNNSSIISDDISTKLVGFDFSLAFNGYFTKKIDFLVELGYSHKFLSDFTFKNFFYEKKNIGDYDVDQLYVNFIFDYYLIEPDKKKFNFSLTGGIGTTIINHWYSRENITFSDNESFNIESIENIKPYFIIGATGGTEQIRISLRYERFLGNYISEFSVYNSPDEFNFSEERFLFSKNNQYSLKITYYFTKNLY